MNSIQTYLRLNNRVVIGDLKCALIKTAIQNLSLIYICIPEIFKTFVKENMELKVSIKAFWYTK